ncbi:MAG: hypothetical protein Q4E38_08060 [Eubacteriales bacterium]|nr:hypothetical protein [Eubacteriales bacterium]
MRFPTLAPGVQTRRVTDVFNGLDRRLRAPDGCFRDTENLSARHWPLLSTRLRRGVCGTLESPGGLLGKDALCHVAGGTLYVNGLPTALTGLSPGLKQLVGMGAYVLVFPDKKFYNTEDPTDCGSMEADFTLTGDLTLSLCGLDGTPWPDPTPSPTAPEAPANGALWLQSGEGGATLCQWSEALGLWNELSTVYTRVEFTSEGEIPRLFRAYDGVEIEGLPLEDLNGSKILYALGGGEGERDCIVLAGLCPAAFTAENVTVRLRRRVPDMDFVCQCQNRLWGCRYGRNGDETVNELYASALGDFKNFRQYLGLATDSWTASVGSDGEWTGAVSYLGHPLFFKEDRLHTVTISPIGAHSVEEIVCRGVQKGSERSLCVVGESLYYKAPGEVCVWQGGFPQSVSAALGEERFFDAVGGAIDGIYYLSMRGETEGWRLFSYDTRRGLWYREDALHALCFAAARGELYAVDAESGALLALKGTAGEPEADFAWMAETGLQHYETADRKYLSRYNLTLRLSPGAELSIALRYDSAGDWEESGTLRFSGTGTVTVPIRPRRCDHLQLRLSGRGEGQICALTRVLEVGSDV